MVPRPSQSLWDNTEPRVSNPAAILQVLKCIFTWITLRKLIYTCVVVSVTSDMGMFQNRCAPNLNAPRQLCKMELLYFEWSPPWHLSICYWSRILSGIYSGILSGISSGIQSGISSGILFGKSHGNFIWHIFWHSIWHSIWHIFWHSICPLRSSSAHWAGEVPGWGPAVHTALGKSQVEVQRCTLSLRSSGAYWAGQVPGWGPSAHWAGKLAKSLAKRVGKELGEELARRKWRWKLMQTWSRRN